jgi:peptidoglycan/xylan/chitin deacetylase (PgdA/CDA1 family)
LSWSRKGVRGHDIVATWFVPGHTVDTFPDICKRISEEGHEMAYHGYAHEGDTSAEKDQTFEMALPALKRVSGKNPVGCRYPAPLKDMLWICSSRKVSSTIAVFRRTTTILIESEKAPHGH